MPKIEQQPIPPKWISLRNLGSTGLNLYDDIQDIKDTDLAESLNMVYDKGYPTPRGGSSLMWSKPVGETNNLLNLFNATASDGTEYAIACYAPNFYFRDETNNQWVLINSTYTPSATYKLLPYGYINWEAGVSKDIFYCGNGTENCIQWNISVGYVSTLASSGATSIVLSDSTKFGSTGTIVIKTLGGSEVYTTFSANVTSTGTLTVPSLGADVAAGSVVCSQIASNSAVPKGKIFAINQGRLYVANQKGGESTLYSSAVGDTTTWTPGNIAGNAFFQVIPGGTGGITGLDDFGDYLLIEKKDLMAKLTITITTTNASSYTTNTSQTVQVIPITSGVSSGVLHQFAKIKHGNILFHVTPTEGIRGTAPDSVSQGVLTPVEELFISRPINPFVQTLDFTLSKIMAWNQKILFSCQSNTETDTILVIDLFRSKLRRSYLEYDSVYVWSRFDNWPVQDWLTHNDLPFFGSRIDGNIYQCFTTPKIDNNTPFETNISTKMWDFGVGPLPKTMSKIYVQGYISAAQALNFDVLFNIGGSLQTVTYQ